MDYAEIAEINIRRRLLGPESDPLHPDFLLRPNRPDENFVLTYTITVTPRPLRDTSGNLLVLDPDHITVTERTGVTETIRRRGGAVVEICDIPPAPTIDRDELMARQGAPLSYL